MFFDNIVLIQGGCFMKSSVKKILAVILTGVIVFTLASCSLTDKVQEIFVEETSTTEPYDNKTEKPKTINEIVKYFNDVSKTLKDTKNIYNVTMSRDFSAHDFECENSNLKAALPTVVDFIIGHAGGEFYERGLDGRECVENGKIGNVVEIYPIELSGASSVVDFRQVKLASCSQTDDHFIITIEFKDDATPLEADGLSKVFNKNDKEAILEELKDANDLLAVSDYDVEYNGGSIVCKVERKTDRIVEASYSRTIKVTADVTGKGNFESVGDQTVVFNLNENENYHVDWVNPETLETTTGK